MRAAVVLAAAIGFGVTTARQPPAPKDALAYPVVAGYGGVAVVPGAAEPPRKGAKLVFDITAGGKPGEVNKGLERVARLLNLYGASGLKAGDVRVAAVLHGEATSAALADAAYAAKFQSGQNPNLPLVRELRKAGVEVFVCGQALHHRGFQPGQVGEGVTVAVAALTVVVNRQADGHAYVSVP